jgi:rsbT co-antagonist protein RsbR
MELSEIVRRMFDDYDVIAYAVGLDGTILVSEGKALSNIGLKPGQLVGTNLFTMFPDADHPGSDYRRAMAGETVETISEYAGREVMNRYRPLLDADGALAGFIGTTTDVTESRHAARELKVQAAAVQQQAELLDLAHDAIIVRDLDGTIRYWNGGAARIYGFTVEQAVGQPIHALLRTGPDSEREAMERALATAGHWEGELQRAHRDGRALIVESRSVLRRGSEGAADSVLELASDITVRKQAEADEARRQHEIIRAQAVAIEELSTPLIPITSDILVMPLIGMLDTVRAKQVMESLLGGLASSRGKYAIIDITGVPVVDTAVAAAIVRSAHAARLLGTEVILTGIRPEVAQTLVHIGTDLGNITVRGTLESGIKYALGRRGLQDG